MSRSMKENMVKNPYVIHRQKKVGDALLLMKELEIRHLPVVDIDGQILGVVSERDVRTATALPQANMLNVGDIMKTELHLARKDTPLRDAIWIMAENRLGSTVVINDEDQPIGIFTTTDALYMLCNFIEDESVGAILSSKTYEKYASASF
jgi:CBS domain-containing protein